MIHWPKLVLSTLVSFCSLSICAGQTLTINPPSFSFNVPAGVQSSVSQLLTVTPDAAAQGRTVVFQVDTTGATWLLVTNLIAVPVPPIPAGGKNLPCNVNPDGLPPGQTYGGFFVCNVQGVPESQKSSQVPVPLFPSGLTAT